MELIEPGVDAPDFTLADQDGDPVSLGDFAGRTLVLYFYPHANTPGCTTQACGVRDRGSEYAAMDAVVVGVSPDPVAEVEKFHARQQLDFTLLADEDHAVCDSYGVWVEKARNGRTNWGAARATFIIGPDGKVARTFADVSPETHDDVVLAALAELQAAA